LIKANDVTASVIIFLSIHKTHIKFLNIKKKARACGFRRHTPAPTYN